MKIIIIFAILLMMIGCSTTPPIITIPEPSPIQVCDRVIGDIDYTYCYYRVGGSPDLIVFLHGALGSEKSWHSSQFKSFKHFLELQSLMGDKSPQVLSISFDDTYMLTNEADRHHGQNDATTNNLMTVIKTLEGKYNIKPKRRLLLGISQGGFNSLRMMFSFPESFQKVALLQPMIPLCDPWNLLDRRCWLNAAGGVSLLVKGNYHRDLWHREGNPLALIVKASKEKFKNVKQYLTVGSLDNFKFNINGAEYVKLTKNRGFHIQYEPHLGDHYFFNAEKLAKFLLE